MLRNENPRLNLLAFFSRPNIKRRDIVAGFSGAIAGTPQAMGFALIAGVNPAYGLYTAIVSTLIAALFGNSHRMTVGPTNALALVVASAVANQAGTTPSDYLFVLTALVGIFYFAFGIFRLGVLVRFVSNAVMTGFITGASLLIIFGQVKYLNGYAPMGDGVLLRFVDWVRNLHQSEPTAVVVSIVSVIVILLVRRTQYKYFALLTSFVVASGLVLLLGWQNVDLVQDIATIPQGLPHPTQLNLGLVNELLPIALAIAILGSVQSAAIINSIKEPSNHRPNVNRDLLGMGLGNIVGGFFQSMPSSGSLSRTAINISAGAQSRWANVFAGLFVALFVVLFGSVIALVALPALGVQLIVAAIGLINIREITFVWGTGINGRIAMLATFVSTLVLPLEFAIYIGVIISLVLYLISASQDIQVVQLKPVGDGRYRTEPLPQTLSDNTITILSLHGHLYFAAIARLGHLLPDPNSGQNCIVILRLRENTVLASTGIHFLETYSATLQRNGGRLLLAGLSPTIHQRIMSMNSQQIMDADLYDADDIYFQSTTDAYKHAQELLASTKE